MSVSIHRPSRIEQASGFVIRPAILLTILFLGTEWIVHLLSVTGTTDLHATIYAHRGFVLGSQVVAVLLAIFVGIDCWRIYRSTRLVRGLVAGVMALVALLGQIWLVRAFGALAAS